MKFLFTIFIAIVTVFFLNACDFPEKHGYHEKNGKIVFGYTYEDYVTLPVPANPDKFDTYFGYSDFGHDDSNVFVIDQILPVDVKTFEVVEKDHKNYFAKDKNGHYFIGCRRYRCAFQKVENLEVDALKIVGKGYYKDTDTVFWSTSNMGVKELIELQDADPDSFELIEPTDNSRYYGFSKDHQHVYREGVLIEGANAPTFAAIDKVFSKDNNHVYYYDKVIEGAQPNSFEVIDKTRSKDQNHVFLKDEVIENSQSDSFQFLGEYYSKDAENVYYKGQIVPLADPETFELFSLDSSCRNIGRDENYVFRGIEINERYSAIDWVRMKPINTQETYYSDSQNIYWSNSPCAFKQLKEVDLETFQSNDSSFGFDKYFVYYHYVTIPNVDPRGFEAISFNFIRNDEKAMCRVAHDRPFNEIDADLETLTYNEGLNRVEDRFGSFVDCQRK